MILHLHPLFRAGAWVLIIAGVWYLYLGFGAPRDGVATARIALVVVGVAAIAVGTALLRWIGRARD